jgi:hypothetical protein
MFTSSLARAALPLLLATACLLSTPRAARGVSSGLVDFCNAGSTYIGCKSGWRYADPYCETKGHAEDHALVQTREGSFHLPDEIFRFQFIETTVGTPTGTGTLH